MDLVVYPGLPFHVSSVKTSPLPLYVDGNRAWVSGVITEGRFEDVDFAGLSVSTMVQDNGISANDPPDQISFSWIGPPELGPFPAFDCQDHPDVLLFDVPQGQVTVN